MLSSRPLFSGDASAKMQSLFVATDRRFGKLVAATLVIGLCVALLIGMASYMTVDRLSRLRAQAVASHDIALILTNIMTSVDDAESGQRGFIITGDGTYLARYEKAKLDLPKRFNELNSRTAPEDIISTSILKWDIEQKMDELQDTIDLRRTKGYDSARTFVVMGRGEELMDRIKNRVAAMSADQDATYAAFVVKINTLYQQLVILMGILLACELVLFVGVLFMIMRDRTERLANARILSAQNERLRNQRDNLNFANDHLEVAFKRFQSLFQGVPVSCTCTGPKGEILEWNKASETLFGFTTEEALKSTLYDTVVRPSGFTHARNLAVGVMSGQSYENVEWVCRTKDGNEIDVMSNALPLVGEDGHPIGVMTATINMTERKAVERLKSEFVSTVSHELRTPLTSIRGALGLVCSGAVGTLPDQARRLCEIANNNTERLVRLINDILDIEKIEAGNLAFNLLDCSVGDLARNCVEAIRSYADQFHVRIVLKTEDSGIKVTGDPDRLSQVLHNLLSNAVKFSPPTGEVIVEVRAVDGDVRVSVQDSGSGIPEEFHSRIFGRFAQADSADTRQKGGTGLGLSISKAIIERLNGQIWFETLEVGTRFIFQLPQAAAGHVNVPIEGSAKVLICEDDKDVVNVLLALLSQRGIQAHVSYTAGGAKDLLAADDYDVMILDVLLPDLNGLDLLQQLRMDPRTEHLPVVVVSVTSKHGLHAITGDGIIDWIGKPLDSRRFLEAVTHAISINNNVPALD